MYKVFYLLIMKAISWCADPICHEVIVQGYRQGTNTKSKQNIQSR